MRFWVLASGSKSNSALVEHDGRCILIDCGLGAKATVSKIEACGFKLEDIDCCLITHSHGDHWNQATMKLLAKNNIKVFAREEHGFEAESYGDEKFSPVPWAEVTPISLLHDSPATHGFRIDTPSGSLGYVADTGGWTKRMARLLSGCHVLAIESNHDIEMQRNSGRPQVLIDRILSFHGHLSNDQCCAFLNQIDKTNTRSIALLHMSGECNEPNLALSKASQFGIKTVAGVCGPI